MSHLVKYSRPVRHVLDPRALLAINWLEQAGMTVDISHKSFPVRSRKLNEFHLTVYGTDGTYYLNQTVTRSDRIAYWLEFSVNLIVESL